VVLAVAHPWLGVCPLSISLLSPLADSRCNLHATSRVPLSSFSLLSLQPLSRRSLLCLARSRSATPPPPAVLPILALGSTCLECSH